MRCFGQRSPLNLTGKLSGVEKTCVGHVGGDVKFAACRIHGVDVEGIEIIFDSAKINCRDLSEFFFLIHDQTTLNRQGNDMSSQLPFRRRLSNRLQRRRGRFVRQTARQSAAIQFENSFWPQHLVAGRTPPELHGEFQPGEAPRFMVIYPEGHVDFADFMLDAQRFLAGPSADDAEMKRA